MTTGETWDSYVASYHDEQPGITEDVLAAAVDDRGRNPYEWLLEAVPAGGLVVDLACGSGPVLRRLTGRAVGLDRSAGELARARTHFDRPALVRADAGELPVADGVAGAVTASMCLMVLSRLDRVLAEVARALKLGGVLVATVPTRSGTSTGFAEILADLGQIRVAYPSRLDDVAARLSAALLDVAADDVGIFVRPVANGEDADLVVRSFYAPGAGPDRRRRAAQRLRRRIAQGPVTVAYPVRRIVAVRG